MKEVEEELGKFIARLNDGADVVFNDAIKQLITWNILTSTAYIVFGLTIIAFLVYCYFKYPRDYLMGMILLSSIVWIPSLVMVGIHIKEIILLTNFTEMWLLQEAIKLKG